MEFTEEEKRGFALFEDKALCAECHVLDRGPNGEPPLLTDFTFDNLGVPRNADVPWYTQAAFNPAGKDWIDPGLGGMLKGLFVSCLGRRRGISRRRLFQHY